MKLSSKSYNLSSGGDMMQALSNDLQAKRKEAMGVLGHCPTAEIARHFADIAVPDHEQLRYPENGLVMLRGRIGGDGAPFNLGEATVSRAAVRLNSGEVGFGYTLGRDGEKAQLIALCDALIQAPRFADTIEAKVLTPLRARVTAERKRKAAETAATKVDFYTLVRGEG
ncbi:MAG: phosphonate C-P lyase system protein PhnG [Bradyrhizobiaceae bacterium PARB1]|jgi:alpha-D-ribose 1-methylphosphonate 5-triphosphate synthase subunit PhnG|nr:MAG: phosphonate C-P lyase system protein PhnG [Bradyrhizobiaceae bacterium PARB1]